MSRTFRFEASHRLPYHDGKCQRLHGHSYRLELVFSGSPHPPQVTQPGSGFVVDFGVLHRLVQEELIHPYLDHHHLNDAIPELPYHSVEYLAAWIAKWCLMYLEGRPELAGAQLLRVRLWESDRSWAEADREDPARMGI
ncbi:MAG: 6-carboxytetrahydropterin synthase [Magnetococcus sp. DMHC-6]